MNLPGDRHSGDASSPAEPTDPDPAANDPTDRDAAEEPTDPDPAPSEPSDRDAAARRARHRMAERIAEGLLPETSADERDERDRGGYSASWYAENRPPHHDR